MFNGDAALVDEYRKLGIRAITLIDNERDPLFFGEKLTSFGEKVIALMNGSGMRIDVSHLDPAQKLAVIEASRSPVIVSHTNARSVADLDYNVPDDVLAALKKNRGSVLVSFNRNGVFTEGGEKTDGIAKVADHIDYFVKWLGAGHVGIGSDYQADGKYVAAPLAETDAFARISTELARRGHDASAIRAIMGGNAIRLFGE
jgi:membrane dipeptidase